MVGPRHSDREVDIEFRLEGEGALRERMFEKGLMPIPPYIRGGRSDREDTRDYQTIFAQIEGSVAAPTASLHFTQELMGKVRELGCELAFLTLHVNTASFLPLQQDTNGAFSPPGEEYYQVSPQLLENLQAARHAGRRVVAVGTTAVRALESAARSDGTTTSTALFIQPEFEFKAVDAIITNFHQPGTTHLLLVEAFMGRDLLARVYDHALLGEYRFLSYGDGMILI